MSLINDALKRATQTPGAGKPAAEMETTMKPAPPRTVGLPIYFVPVLLFLISGACWLLVKGWDARRPAGASTQPVPVQARAPQQSPSAEGAELPIPENRQFALKDTPAPSVSPSAVPVATAAGTTAESVSAAVSTETTPVQAFKLQGIFYRPANPSAVINSKTVFIGDRIANAKVKTIDRQSVTLDVEGETKVLTLQ